MLIITTFAKQWPYASLQTWIISNWHLLCIDSSMATPHDLSRTFNQSSPHPTCRFSIGGQASCHQIDLVSVNFKPYPLLVAEQGMDGKKQFSNSGWGATQCTAVVYHFSVVLANLSLKSNLRNFISNCHPKNGGNESFVCWRCTDWQGMCFPTKNDILHLSITLLK